MKRVAQVIKLKAEQKALYLLLHQNVWKTIAQQIHDSNIRNYSIFLYQDTLFSYFEYIGKDFDADMEKMASHEDTKQWWSLTDPCQQPVENALPGEWWHTIEEIFHQD